MKKFFLLLAVLLCGTAIAQEPQNSQQEFDPASDEAAQAGAEANPEDTIQYAGILNVIGDSYVRNHKCPIEETWHYKMAKELNLKYNNYGRNGSCIAWDRTNDGKHNFGPAIVERDWDLEPDADYVLVIAGHNDACKIGDSKDSAEMFRDSMEVLIANIRTQCPNAKIGFVTPWYVPRLGFDLTCKVMKQVCDKHYVPVLWHHSKYNVIQVRDASFRSQYFLDPKDFAHLNAKGHDLYLPTATAWFKKYMMNNKRKMK